ncbi:glycosyltransferase [Amycolatopsis sp. NPDC059657]|uniref:glycosyltransferase n=1 Tax=Amycolatopsis sp. NPDC059657 TaxID=3346899 RepID=UPI00366ECA33
MKALIYAYGSRGDVQPYLALAHALNESGHKAVLAGPAKFAKHAAGYDVDYIPRNDELLDFYVDDPDVSAWLRNQGNNNASTREIRKTALDKLSKEFIRCFPGILREISAAAEGGADVVVQSYEALPFEQGHHVAERIGAPVVLATLFPNYVPSWHYPAKYLPADKRFPRVVRRLSHLPARVLRPIGKMPVDMWRAEVLGLPPRRGAHNRLRRPDGGPVPVLNGFSEQLVPPAPDWPTWVHPTGFWYLPPDSDYHPPRALTGFLSEGDPPICVSLGTVRGLDPHAAGRLVTEAVQRAGVRAVVIRASGSIEIADPPPSIHLTDDIPYWWLLQYVSAIVHAAGVGTINEALRIGIPQVPCPVHNEQLMWGVSAHRAGVATAPIRVRDLRPDNLAGAIRKAVTDQALIRQARALAEIVHPEDGVRRAVTALENIVAFAERARISQLR